MMPRIRIGNMNFLTSPCYYNLFSNGRIIQGNGLSGCKVDRFIKKYTVVSGERYTLYLFKL